MVWSRATVQYLGNGPFRTFPRRPLQLLQSTLHHEDCPNASRPDDWTHRVYTQQELHPQRYKARCECREIVKKRDVLSGA